MFCFAVKEKMFQKREAAGYLKTGQKPHRGFYSKNKPFRTNKFNSFGKINPRSPRGKHRFSENIDPSLFVKKSIELTEKQVEIKHSFSDFGLCSELKNNLNFKKFLIPTPIQDQAIPFIIDGKDLIGLANTGTGKTAVFLLPLISKVFKNKSEKVLIITPTRELAIQIEQEFRQFSWNMKLFSASCVGGMPIYKQIGNLKRDPNFVIGTPGRLKDLIDRGQIKLESFNSVVLDEVDRMLDIGFINEIQEILSRIPTERQTLFFSATMPEKIKRLAGQFLKDPIIVEVKQSHASVNVDQDIVRVQNQSTKFKELTNILERAETTKVLIFIETKAEVERITANLLNDGFKVDFIHGDKKQNKRARAITSFKKNEIRILVATDVAARGLDIDNISHVINYTIPQSYDDYIHRIGRTGRGSNKGVALTFVS